MDLLCWCLWRPSRPAAWLPSATGWDRAERGASTICPLNVEWNPCRSWAAVFQFKFFVVALLFVLFDIELIFLFSWAVIYQELGLFGFMEMLVFLLVVLSGLFYSVKKGVLQWK